ncbi:segregation/condensation protein A [Candidatus Mycoplasma mahonii]|uniref:segregation/condensation protein A n=1 Tax=Candidatus Mycoplasma mahonii TaxID=3004105 RepID=UPI0026EFF68F|nr:segregation/condensation protein A [Candidatus Mycoplasma mahonii]WKX02225.1 segregation/condensation protein A [Candidatus Mycoplasma mahonii]
MEQNIELQINNYEGPLDLLLSLVKDKKMNIFDIDIAELATAYLQIIDLLKEKNIDLAGDYLVMASSLLHLKTKMLLDDGDKKNKIEKEKHDLLSQLAEYHQFKMVGQELRDKELRRKNIFIKEASDYDNYQLVPDESILDGHSNPIKLIEVMRKMFERINAQKLREVSIEKFNLSPAERRLEIIKLFNEKEKRTFVEIFNVPTIDHFVVTMITILDMSRKQELILAQDEQYGNITITKGVINE